jgi:hypothetical protein
MNFGPGHTLGQFAFVSIRTHGAHSKAPPFAAEPMLPSIRYAQQQRGFTRGLPTAYDRTYGPGALK